MTLARGRRRARPEQAFRACRARRLGHEAPYRRHARGARQGRNRPVLVHRLDRDTSGVPLIAKNRRSAAALGEAFRRDRRRKSTGRSSKARPSSRRDASLSTLPRARAWATNGRRANPAPARPATLKDADCASRRDRRAAFLDLLRHRRKSAPRCAWLSMKPLTGRTHQLRAHGEAIGHPIFGDSKYGHRPEDEVRRRDPPRAGPPRGWREKLHLLARRLVLPPLGCGSTSLRARRCSFLSSPSGMARSGSRRRTSSSGRWPYLGSPKIGWPIASACALNSTRAAGERLHRQPGAARGRPLTVA